MFPDGSDLLAPPLALSHFESISPLESTVFLIPIPLKTYLLFETQLKKPFPSQSWLFPSFLNSSSNIPPFTIYPAIFNCMFASLSSWLKWALWGRKRRSFSSLSSDSTRCFWHDRHSGTTGGRIVQMRGWAPLSGQGWEPRAATSRMASEAISFSSIQTVKRIDTSGLT